MTEICGAMHATVGLRTHCLGMLEASRRGLGVRQCFSARHDIALRHGETYDALREKVRAALENIRPKQLLCPLHKAHVDHALARAAAEAQGLPVFYYEDQPYVAIYQRMAEGERERLVRVPDDPLAGSSLAVHELGRFLSPLSEVVPQRHLQRILSHYQRTDGITPEALWREGEAPTYA